MKNTSIKEILIKNLWSRCNIKLPMNKDVNIIVGKNGTGKSTVLDLIPCVISQKKIRRNLDLDEAKITFYNDESISFSRMKRGNFPELNSENFDIDELLSVIKKNFLDEMEKNKEDNKKLKLEFNKPKEIEEIEEIEIIKISTFDMELKNRKAVINEKEEFLRTELDLILYNLIEDFKLYQYQLKSKIEEESEKIDLNISLLNNKHLKKNQIDNNIIKELDLLRALVEEKKNKKEEIYYFKEKFRSILHDLYNDTNKEIFIDENNLIKFKVGKHTITPYDLSSGEKQMLVILLQVLLTENKFCLLLMDEPEISLHVQWQNQLIDNLRKLNSNMQIIISTHSPAIVSKGWKDKVIEMKNFIEFI